MTQMERESAVFVAGHKGLVGSSIMRNLRAKGFTNLVTRDRSELDLLNQAAVHDFFRKNRIDHVFVAAAKVGGILYNKQFQADFLYENVITALNIIHAAAETNVKKLLYLGSSCIYPKMAPQPIKEDYLLTGPLEPTNEGYALAKIVGLKMCEKYRTQYGKNFISAMPTNLFGEGDNFHPDHSHVIPGLFRRFHEAKVEQRPEVVIWGTGSPRREFLYVDDLAEALYVLMQRYEGESTINVGTGQDCTILEVAELIRDTVGYTGRIVTDPSKPDGTPRKVLDVARMRALDWAPRYSLKDGLKLAYDWALKSGALR